MSCDAHRKHLEAKLDGHVRQPYNDYIATYQVKTEDPCEHEHSAIGVVHINERGNLCEDLPFLAMTCRQIFAEMWMWCFLTPPLMENNTTKKTPAKMTKEEKQKMMEERERMTKTIRYTAKVKNFDFFPVFRFLQMLRQLPIGVHVQGSMVDIVLEDDNEEEETCDTKYEKVKRLIEAHWLENLPLWGCVTGLREEAGLKQKSRNEKRTKRLFWKWLYSVRRIVAVYHIKRSTWRDVSVKHLNLWDAFQDEDSKEKRRWESSSDAEIVEAIILFLSEAIEFNCGWRGNWGYGDDDAGSKEDTGCFRNPLKLVSNELEHAQVHVANRYCFQIGTILENELGDLYSEWENFDDKRMVPKDIVL
jgi:hypothetical protein